MKQPTFNGRELLPLSVMEAAHAGDAIAMEQVLRYYECYINKLCIYKFIEEHETRQDLVLTFALYCAIPIVVLFILCQRYIVDGLTFGSVKG